LLLVLGALRVVRGLRARLRLDVLARHDDHAVVVVGALYRRLDALELAALEERAVLVLQPVRVARGQLPLALRGPQHPALPVGAVDRADRPLQGAALAHHARVAAGGPPPL